MAWAHDIHVTYIRGGFAVVTCSCGDKTGKITRDQVEQHIANHRSKYMRVKPEKR